MFLWLVFCVTRRRFRSEEEFEAWLRRRRILYWIITAIGIMLIVIGCILKYSSPPVVGDVASILGLVVSVYGLLSSRQEEVVERLRVIEVELHEGFRRMEVLLREIRDELRRG